MGLFVMIIAGTLAVAGIGEWKSRQGQPGPPPLAADSSRSRPSDFAFAAAADTIRPRWGALPGPRPPRFRWALMATSGVLRPAPKDPDDRSGPQFGLEVRGFTRRNAFSLDVGVAYGWFTPVPEWFYFQRASSTRLTVGAHLYPFAWGPRQPTSRPEPMHPYVAVGIGLYRSGMLRSNVQADPATIWPGAYVGAGFELMSHPRYSVTLDVARLHTRIGPIGRPRRYDRSLLTLLTLGVNVFLPD